MKDRTFVALSLSLVLLPIAASLSAQEKPYRPKAIPAGKDARTLASVDRDHVAIWRALLLADCVATGALADPWKEDIEQLVDAYAEVCGMARAGNDSYQQIYDLVERLQRKECKLPLAQLAFGDTYAWQRQWKQAAAPFAEVAKVADKHSPAFRMMFAVAREGLFVRSDASAQAALASNDALTELIALASSDDLPGGARATFRSYSSSMVDPTRPTP